MADQERKASLGFEVNDSGVKPGLDNIKSQVRDMAEDVKKSAKGVSDSMKGMADGAPVAAEKASGATRRLETELQRYLATLKAGSKSAPAYWEQMASFRGADVNALRPLLTQLDTFQVKAKDAAKSGEELGGSLSGLGSAASLAGRALAAIGVGASVRELFSMADASTNVASRLSLVTTSTSDLVTVQQKLFDVAQASRVKFVDLTTVYAQVARSTKDLGISQTSLLGVIQTISQAVTISGGSAQSAQAALVQLSQGFASGALRGEELNSVLEQTPRLAQAIADGLGVSIGKLREMGAAGELTASKVLDALEKSAASVQAEFGKMAVTVEQASTQASNSALRLVGVLDKITGASGAAAGGISRLSSGMDSLATDLERISATQSFSDFLFLAFNNQRTLNAELDVSQKELKKLEGQLARAPNNIYTRSAIAEMREYIAQIKEAQARFGQLTGQTVGGGGGRGSINPPTVSENNAARRALDDDLGKYLSGNARQTNSQIRAEDIQKAIAANAKLIQGVSERYQGEERVNKLLELRGALETEIANINEKHKDKADKGLKAEQKAYESLTQTIAEKIAAEKVELETGQKQTESQKLRAKVMQELSGANRASALADVDALAALEARNKAAADAMKTAQQIAAARKKEADGIDEWIRAQEQAAQKAVDSVKDRITSMKDEEEAIAMSRSLNISLAEAVELVTIARLEEKQAGFYEGSEGWNNLQREIKARRELLGLMGTKAAREANDRAAEEAARAWEKTSQTIGDTLADYIMGGGKDAAQYLKRLFATLVLQPVVQTVVGSVIGTGSGLGAATGAGGGAAGLIQGGQTIWSAISGGLTAGVGGAIASAGAAFGSSAATAFGSGIAAGGNLGLFGGGIGQGLSMLGSGAGGTAAGLGTIAGAALPWLAGGLALASVWGSLFGRKLKDQGIEGTFGGPSDFEGRTYQYYKGGLFRSNKTKYGTLDEDLRSGLADQFGALQAGTSEMAKILGLGTDAIDNFTASIKISFNGLDEAGIQNALKAEFEKIAESLSSQTLGTTEFTRNGETAVQTLGRLSGSLSAVNSVFENLSQTLYASSLAGADMASQLVDLFGGADAFGTATGTYFQNFYSEDEQRAAMERQLQAALDKLDLTLPDIDAADARAQWRAQAEALDLTTEAGRKAWAVLIQLSGAFAGITQSAEDAAAAAAAAAAAQARQAEASRSKEQDLQIQLLRAQGNELAAVAIERQRELAALEQFGPAAQGIQRDIWAIIDAAAALQAGADAYFADVDRKAAEQGYVNDAQTALDAIFGAVNAGAQAAAQSAASAAQAAASSWRSAASNIQSSLDRLRAQTTAEMDPAARYSATKAEFDSLTIAALGGDSAAAGKLGSAADAFLEASKAGTATQAEYLRDRVLAEAKLASVLSTSEAQASLQESIAAAANASVSELQALNANLTGFAGALYEILGKGYQGADRGAAQTVAESFAKMQADYDAYFNDLAGFGKVGNKYTDASFNGASFTKLGNNMAAFTGADGIVSYIRAGESLVEVAKRIPELRALWEKNYGIKLPAFDVGANYIPYDMPAMVHKGERIIPAADNRALMSALQGQGGNSTAKLEAQLAQLLDDNRRQAGEIVRLNGQMAKVLRKWDEEGTPPVREEVTA